MQTATQTPSKNVGGITDELRDENAALNVLTAAVRGGQHDLNPDLARKSWQIAEAFGQERKQRYPQTQG